MFGRYATYVGSSPYQAPAIFAMMASLEAEEGIYGVYGGTYEMVCGLEKLARELGVEIHTSTKVDRIQVKDGRAQSVLCGQKEFQADVVVANADALTVYSQLLAQEVRPSMSDRKIGQYEPSHSGFVVLAGVAQRFPQLLHHNVFFPSKYRHEFEQLFHSREVLTEPTIYICYNGLDEQEMAPPGCSNLFILANAPSLGSVDWSAIQDVYAQQLLSMLESYGLSGIKQSLEVCETFTPLDLQQAMGAHQGAIYGISSNRPSQTFFRPANRAKDIDNLWFVGGTTHPGGGTPIVALSGQLVAERLLVEYR
jgi:phytoene desaturase